MKKTFTSEDFLEAKRLFESAEDDGPRVLREFQLWDAAMDMLLAKQEMDKAAWELEMWMKAY